MSKIFTGIGSRATPPDILILMTFIGKFFAERGWIGRSGGANGADTAFEKGFKSVRADNFEAYLPYKGFNKNPSPLYTVPQQAFTMAETLHPAWERCNRAARMLISRNCQQILGQNLDTPTDLVVCWTQNGLDVGGTGTALKLAKSLGIRVINLWGDKFPTKEYEKEYF